MSSVGRFVGFFRPAAVRGLNVEALMARKWSGSAARLGGDGYLAADEVSDRVLSVVKNFEKVSDDKVTASSTFANDLGLDSLDSVELVMAFEDEFAIEIPDAEADKILSCSDAVEYISNHPNAK